METYLFIGSESIINYYFTDDILKKGDKVIIIDYVDDSYYEYDSSFLFDKNRKINNTNYEYYNMNIDDRDFKEFLHNNKIDYIVFGLYGFLKTFDLNEFVKILNEEYVYNKFKLVLLSSISIYDSIDKDNILESELILENKSDEGIFYHYLEQLILNTNISNILFRVGNMLGYYTFDSLMNKRIKSVYNESLLMPFPKFGYEQVMINSYIHIRDIKEAIFKAIDYLDNNGKNEIINLTNSSIDLKDIDDIIIYETNLSDYYNNNENFNKFNNKYYDNYKTRKIDTTKLSEILHINYTSSIVDDIKDTINWYKESHLVNEKLTDELKEEFNNMSKDELRKSIQKYSQNKLSNIEVLNYLNKIK